jgi:cobalamin biosynthesis Mg chelatase CobN
MLNRCLVIMLLLVSLLPAGAGVVDDAEEELKKIQQNRSQDQRVVIDRTRPPLDPRTTRSPKRGAGQNDRRSTSSASGATSGRPSLQDKAVSGLEETPEPRVRKRSNRNESRDKTLSLFGVVLFLLLVVAGTMFGRRGESKA